MPLDDIHAKRLYRDALRVLQLLEEGGHQARLAGGCVRDRQLNLAPKDYDVATSALPQTVSSFFEQKSIKVIPTGIDHGTVTVLMPAGPVEVTTLRRDVKSYGRHADVVFGTSFEEDAERRDFTINAMFEDRQGVIYDFFDGMRHLKARELHFVGDPHLRIREDFLRIMRFFRFWARFQLVPDPAAITAIRGEVGGLGQVSQERITSELMGLLQAESPYAALQSMVDTGTLQLVLPEAAAAVGSDMWQKLAAIKINILPKQALARLACFIPKHFKEVETAAVMQRLRLSNRDQGEIIKFLHLPANLPPLHASPADKMAFVDRCTDDDTSLVNVYLPFWRLNFPQFAEQWGDLEALERQKGHLRRTPIPVTGHDVMKLLQVPAGPQLGEILLLLKDSFRNGEWLDRQQGLKKAQEIWQGMQAD